MLDQIVQAATTCCGITGGVGLLLLGPDSQLSYRCAAADRRRSFVADTQIPKREGPSVGLACGHKLAVLSLDLHGLR